MKLSVLFTDGTTKKYDVAPLAMRIPTFKALEDDSLFNDVQVDVGGYGIIWNTTSIFRAMSSGITGSQKARLLTTLCHSLTPQSCGG